MRRALVFVCFVAGLVFIAPFVAAQSLSRAYLPVVVLPDTTQTPTATPQPQPTSPPPTSPPPPLSMPTSTPDPCDPGLVDVDVLDSGTIIVYEFGDWRFIRFFARNDAVAGAFSNEIQGDPAFDDFVIDRAGRIFTIYPMSMPEDLLERCLS